MLARGALAFEPPCRSGVAPGALIAASSDDEANIFRETVVVQVKPVGRDAFQAGLTLRLRPDDVAHPRSLLLELTDEADLLFYHSLTLGEGDFHALKAEQRLRVDFQGFPQQVAELLRRCCTSGAEAATGGGPPQPPAGAEELQLRMSACLECSASGESLFSIVEANQFRELTHIALRLRQGTDETVKRHLAGKLRQSKAEAVDFASRFRASQQALDQARAQVDELAARARVIAEERTNLERSLETAHQREVAELRTEYSRGLSEVQRGAAEERTRIEGALRQQLAEALERATAGERLAEERGQRLQALQFSSKSCQELLEAAKAKLQDTQQELTATREAQKQLEVQRFQHEREIAELKVQGASLLEQLASKGQLASSHATQAEQAAAQRRSLEENLTSCRKQVQALEEKFAIASQEISKGNQIIQELHSGKKQVQAKLKLKVAALAQQEKTTSELEKVGEHSRRDLEERDQELGRGRERQARLQDDIAELKKKLGEAHDVLRSNQEVIEYLNRQLTEKELRSFPALVGPGAGVRPAEGGGACEAYLGGTSMTPGSTTGGSSLADLLKRAEEAGRSLMSTGTAAPASASSASRLSPGLGGTPSSFGGSPAAFRTAAPESRSPLQSLGLGSLAFSPPLATPDKRYGSCGTSAVDAVLAASSGSLGGGTASGAAAASPARELLQGPVAYRRPGSLAEEMLRAAV